jgi:hypothetical protein
MGGTVAMAYIGCQLIKHADAGQCWTLIADAGTMRAGDQFQAVVASFTPIGEQQHGHADSLEKGFKRVPVGCIPIRNATYAHRVDRMMIIFTEMLAIVKTLGPLLGVDDGIGAKQAEGLTLRSLLLGCNSFLGDHGESGVLEALHTYFLSKGYGSPKLYPPFLHIHAKDVIFYCHFHKLCNFIEYGAKAMVEIEGTVELPSSAIIALDEEFGGQVSGIFAVAKGFRRVGKPSCYSFICDGAKLACTKIGVHESMWKGAEAQVLMAVSGESILKDDGRAWESNRNARGTRPIMQMHVWQWLCCSPQARRFCAPDQRVNW